MGVPGEDAVLEAERLRLTAQRRVLEAELAGLEAIQERHRHELSCAETLLRCERNRHSLLAQELNSMLDGLAQLTGQHEALHIGIEEAAHEACSATACLGPVRALTAGLEANRNAVFVDIEVIHSTERHLMLRAGMRKASMDALHHLAENLAEDMRNQASLLRVSIDACASHGDVDNMDESTAPSVSVMVMPSSLAATQVVSCPIRPVQLHDACFGRLP